MIGGVGGSLFRISCSALYYKVLGETNKGAKLGFFSGMGLLGYGLGPLFAGHFTGIELDMDFILLRAIWVLLPLLLLSLFLEDVKPAKIYLREYWRDIQRKDVIILASLGFLLALHIGAEQTSFSLFLETHVNLTMDSIGMMFCFIGIAIASLCIIDGFLSDKMTGMGRRLSPLLYLGMFFSGLFNISLLFTRTFASVLSIRILHVFGDSLFMVLQRVIISNLFLSERIGGSLGMMDAVFTLGIFSGALISGALPGYIVPFVFAGSLAIIAIPFANLAKPKF